MDPAPADLQKVLDEHPFTRGLPLHERIKLSRLARREHYEPGELLQTAGAASEKLHLIVKGSAVLEMPRSEGRTQRLLALGPGDVAGWSWMVEPYHSAFDVRALEPVEALAFDGDRLRAHLEDDNFLGYLVLKRLLAVVSKRILSARVQMLDENP